MLDSRRGWAVVAADFAAMATTFGIVYSFGAFYDEMRADLGASRGAAATLFSLTSLAFFGLGGATGAAADRYGQRRVLVVGAAAMGLGLVVTAHAHSLPMALVAYCLGAGLGVACAYVPMVALVGAWFERRRTLALGGAGRRGFRAAADAGPRRRGRGHRRRDARVPAGRGRAHRVDRLARHVPR